MRLGLLLFLCGFIYPSFATTEIIMGYRTTAKMPYIHAEPSDDGFYFELYDEAAKRIGATLKVVRLPKLRVLIALEAGRSTSTLALPLMRNEPNTLIGYPMAPINVMWQSRSRDGRS